MTIRWSSDFGNAFCSTARLSFRPCLFPLPLARGQRFSWKRKCCSSFGTPCPCKRHCSFRAGLMGAWPSRAGSAVACPTPCLWSLALRLARHSDPSGLMMLQTGDLQQLVLHLPHCQSTRIALPFLDLLSAYFLGPLPVLLLFAGITGLAFLLLCLCPSCVGPSVAPAGVVAKCCVESGS